MEYRVLGVPDTHWRDTDFSTIGGYCEATLLTAQDVLRIMRDAQVTHVIHFGDWCDKGYQKQQELHSHRNILQEMNEYTKDNVYMNLGNHFFIERDSNPELYWIQPHDVYKPIKYIYASKPLIKVTTGLLLGCVQFSFFHYHKENKMYVAPRVPEAKYHCGIYHDDCVVPAHVRLDEGIKSRVSNEYLRNIFANIDFACVGHIHTPVGEVQLNIDGREIPMDIPGSLAVVTSKPSDLHTSVKLPLFTITENSFKKEYVEVSLNTDKLKFYSKKAKPLEDKKFIIEDLRGADTVQDLLKLSTSSYMSPETFLRMKGLSEKHLDIYRSVSTGSLEIPKIVKIIARKDNFNGTVEKSS